LNQSRKVANVNLIRPLDGVQWQPTVNLGISELLEGCARANESAQTGWPEISGHEESVLAKDEVEGWFDGTSPFKKRRGLTSTKDGSGPR
jgi:hypothetical protein